MKNIFINISAKQNIYKNNKLNPNMKKRSVLFLGIIFLLNLISAYSRYNSGGSLSDFLYRLDSKSVLLIFSFIIFFTILHFVLSKSIIKGDPKISGVIAFCMSFLMVYYMNQRDFFSDYLWWDVKIWWEDLWYSTSWISIPILIIILIVIGWIIQIIFIRRSNKKNQDGPVININQNKPDKRG